jgi:hypothetical protein
MKLRAAKNEGADKITMIDHTASERHSCSVLEAVTHLARLVEKGAGEHMIHVVDLKAEKERKLKNPKGSTKRVFNCRTPEQLIELNTKLEPFYEEAVDPHIAIDLIVRALNVPRETIRSWVHEGEEERQGPPPAAPLPGDEWFHAREPGVEPVEDDLPEELR